MDKNITSKRYFDENNFILLFCVGESKLEQVCSETFSTRFDRIKASILIKNNIPLSIQKQNIRHRKTTRNWQSIN